MYANHLSGDAWRWRAGRSLGRLGTRQRAFQHGSLRGGRSTFGLGTGLVARARVLSQGEAQMAKHFLKVARATPSQGGERISWQAQHFAKVMRGFRDRRSAFAR